MSLEVQVGPSAQVVACDCLPYMDLVAASHDLDRTHAVEVPGYLEDQDPEGIGPFLLDSAGRDADFGKDASGRPDGHQAREVTVISFGQAPFEVVASQEIEVAWRCWGLSVLHESDSH